MSKSPILEGMVLCHGVPYADCVCSLNAVWLEIWLYVLVTFIAMDVYRKKKE